MLLIYMCIYENALLGLNFDLGSIFQRNIFLCIFKMPLFNIDSSNNTRHSSTSSFSYYYFLHQRNIIGTKTCAT